MNPAVLLLTDESRRLVASRVQRLETIAQCRGLRNDEERDFYRDFFDNIANDVVLLDEALGAEAEALITRHSGLGAADALHVACALRAGADEIVTTERPGKPMHLVTEIRVVHLPVSARS